MPKQIKHELKELIQHVESYPEGLSADELSNLLHSVVPKRTLQYRLSSLVKAGALRVEGKGKSTRYCKQEAYQTWQLYPRFQKSLTVAESKDEYSSFPYASNPSIIPYSSTSYELQKLITAPKQLRQYVSYKKTFLNAYVPNQTFYLTQPIIEKLTRLGTSVSDKGRPAGTHARKIYQRLLIDLSWNSSRLEGNTYSLLETEKLLETGEEVPGKNHRDAQMILNHKDAIGFMVEMADEIDINRYTILNIHCLLSDNLLSDQNACGRLRTVPVRIGKSVYLPLEVPQLIEEHFQVIIQKAAAIENPFEQSFFLMVHLPYLQPFLDVNKRVSRLAGNIPFIRENLCPISFVDVPEMDYIYGLLAIYELNRIELFRDVFVWAYERSASLYHTTLENLGQPDPFRLRYRDLIRQVVFEVVQKQMHKFEAAQFISRFAHNQIPKPDCNRFIEVAEIEVSSLHEGSLARFKIKPADFSAWTKKWR